MTDMEFSKFSMALKTYYPRENLLPNPQSMELWFAQLQDIPYEVAELALNKWVAVNKWSPSIADIREMAAEITKGQIKDWGEGWEQVMTAIRKYGSYNQVAAMDSLDDLTRQTVKRLGYMNLCRSENISADRANFRMIYEQLAERTKKENQISVKLQDLISSVQVKMLEGGGE